MITRLAGMSMAAALSGLVALAVCGEAKALTAKECGAKYQAAKAAGTLGAKTFNEFRKAECAADAAAAPSAAPAAAPATPPPATAAAPKPAAPPPGASAAVFPKAVDPKYSSES